jgi:hypothetical protein
VAGEARCDAPARGLRPPGRRGAAPQPPGAVPLHKILLEPTLALAVLILVLDRPGPVKFWVAPLLFVSFSPLLALCYDVVVLVNYLNYQAKPNLGVCLVVNVVFHGAFAVYLDSMGSDLVSGVWPERADSLHDALGPGPPVLQDPLVWVLSSEILAQSGGVLETGVSHDLTGLRGIGGGRLVAENAKRLLRSGPESSRENRGP